MNNPGLVFDSVMGLSFRDTDSGRGRGALWDWNVSAGKRSKPLVSGVDAITVTLDRPAFKKNRAQILLHSIVAGDRRVEKITHDDNGSVWVLSSDDFIDSTRDIVEEKQTGFAFCLAALVGADLCQDLGV